MNFLAYKYVVEIEVIRHHDGVDPVSSYLRYVTCNNISQAIYPYAYITILQRLVAKAHNHVLDFDWTSDFFDSSLYRSKKMDNLFNQLVVNNQPFPMLMKKDKHFDSMPIHVQGIILETPKG